MTETPFRLRSQGSPFKQIGASEIVKKTVESVPAIVGNVETAGIAHEVGTLIKSKSGSSTISSISKNIPKIVRGAGRLASKAILPLTIAEALYSFGSESVKRTKSGESGFNLSKTGKPKKNQPFNF